MSVKSFIEKFDSKKRDYRYTRVLVKTIFNVRDNNLWNEDYMFDPVKEYRTYVEYVHPEVHLAFPSMIEELKYKLQSKMNKNDKDTFVKPGQIEILNKIDNDDK